MTHIYATDCGNFVRFEVQTLPIESRPGEFVTLTTAVITSPGAPKCEASVEIHRVLPDGTEEFLPGHARFQKQYEAWLSKSDGYSIGTPVESLPGINPAFAERLRTFKILTLEALATASDAALTAFGPGGMALRDQAAEFVAERKGNERVDALATENAELKDMLAEMAARLKVLEEAGAKPAKPGKAAKADAEPETV